MEARSFSSELKRLCSNGGALGAILPASASTAFARHDIPGAPLFAAEEAAVEGAVETRRREFATARACARVALGRWGLSRQPIPVGPAGEPLWPAGIVGSITHCDGYRACAAAHRVDLLAVGIDAEPAQPLPAGTLAAVAFDDELAQVRRLVAEEPSVPWGRLLFSAKEAVFKAWYSLTGQRLGFEDAHLVVDPFSGTFSAHLAVRAAGEQRGFRGRWALDEGIVLTAVAVTR
jgi:enterobactin synthetase component D / holo-[acyl-carrier protein] synthase